jgi:glutamate-1-semialdehyde aminotransferase
MAAIIGVGRVMQAAQASFISSTYWTERIGPTAALATIRKHRQQDVSRHLISTGNNIQAGWAAAAGRTGLSVHISGIPPLSHISFDYENGQSVATLFTQLMLERGFLASKGFYVSYAHSGGHVRRYLDAIEEVFRLLVDAIQRGNVEENLKGPVAHIGFRRLT